MENVFFSFKGRGQRYHKHKIIQVVTRCQWWFFILKTYGLCSNVNLNRNYNARHHFPSEDLSLISPIWHTTIENRGGSLILPPPPEIIAIYILDLLLPISNQVDMQCSPRSLADMFFPTFALPYIIMPVLVPCYTEFPHYLIYFTSYYVLHFPSYSFYCNLAWVWYGFKVYSMKYNYALLNPLKSVGCLWLHF